MTSWPTIETDDTLTTIGYCSGCTGYYPVGHNGEDVGGSCPECGEEMGLFDRRGHDVVDDVQEESDDTLPGGIPLMPGWDAASNDRKFTHLTDAANRPQLRDAMMEVARGDGYDGGVLTKPDLAHVLARLEGDDPENVSVKHTRREIVGRIRDHLGTSHAGYNQHLNKDDFAMALIVFEMDGVLNVDG